MSIIIHGVKMPKEGLARNISIFEDGDVIYYGGSTVIGKAIELPPHGRLIDADALKKQDGEFCDPMGFIPGVAVEDIDDAPTIIPADRPKEETIS